MALLTLNNISLSFGAEKLLNGVDLNIEPGDRACLIGRNGTGKSSLLKLIQGDLAADGGEIVRHGDTRVAYLPQDVPPGLTGRVGDIVAAGLQHGGPGAHTEWEAEQLLGKVISHLSLDADAALETLSGGQKRRVLLARALAGEPDLLLLDEPTNHLDIESICWMEEYLLRHCKTFLFVTHDRAFLRRLANKIIDLDRGTLVNWSCTYDQFLRRKADFLHDESVRNAAFDKKLTKEEAWIRQGIKARRTRDEGRVRALMEMRDSRRARRALQGTARLNVQEAEKSGHKVIQAKGISFSYGDGKPIVNNLDLQVMRGDRIGVIGPNGSGKTTLLKLLTGELGPNEGSVLQGTKLEPAYFDQHRAILKDEETVAENVADGQETVQAGGQPRHVISYLQDFLFPPDQAKSPVKMLSGGERNRLLLARLFATPSNLLVMDEPTNDLDAETLELLEEQLLAYSGTILLVSHDRAFLDNVVTNLLVCDGSGSVSEYIGGYEDWARSQRATVAAKKATAKKAKQKNPKAFGFKQKRELAEIPDRIHEREAEQEALHDRMAAPAYFKTPADQIAAHTARTDVLVTELETLYERWAELEALAGT
jgi:ATP-binding cassette subfamily F protein uup